MASAYVSVSWLKEQLASDTPLLRVIDASFPMPGEQRDTKAEYESEHIKGATFFSFKEVRDTESKFALMLPSPEKFAEHVGKVHGVSNKHAVVIYDNNPKHGLFSASRLWWMFRVFGHGNVSVLAGGLPKWCAEGGETTSGVAEGVEPAEFTPAFRPELVKSFEDVLEALSSKSHQVCDARSAARFSGTASEPNPKLPSGHMVGAVNVPFPTMVNMDEKLLKSPDALKEAFTAAGVDLSKPMLTTCGSGVTACFLAFCAFLCGTKDVPVFDGSWTEYVQRAPADRCESLQFPQPQA